MQYQKIKSVSKEITVKSKRLDNVILDTMKTVSTIVGSTLGPGGQPVLIERFEHDLQSSLTKDGVTVFRSLGFNDPTAHCIMESARDASIRTAEEAGDGTTTATILAEAIVRKIHEYCKEHPRQSPQKVVRHLEEIYKLNIEPTIKKYSKFANLEKPEEKKWLHSVAKVSANGDTALADAVMTCFDLTGDQGNVTITELNGPSHYEVEHIQGFPIENMGYEESCGKFYSKFINDPGTQRTVMENPVFLLYHGNITEIQTIILFMQKIAMAWEAEQFSHNVVIVATGFSESVIANLAANFPEEDCINVFPLRIPLSPFSNGQMQFLQDLAAVTGSKILDPISNPIDRQDLDVLGGGVKLFEASRFRSTIIGYADEGSLQLRVEELEQQLQSPESTMDAYHIKTRIAKLSGGIAKLKVIGNSNGELKEKRDRAEDAVCGVRGAIKSGCLPGGGWMLMKIMSVLPSNPIIDEILRPALMEPVNRLLFNCGINNPDEIKSILDPILNGIKNDKTFVYDFMDNKIVDAYEGGILDSTPAVLEAIKNSISIAALLGTLGGCVVYSRDRELERSEALATQDFLRNANVEENDR